MPPPPPQVFSVEVPSNGIQRGEDISAEGFPGRVRVLIMSVAYGTYWNIKLEPTPDFAAWHHVHHVVSACVFRITGLFVRCIDPTRPNTWRPEASHVRNPSTKKARKMAVTRPSPFVLRKSLKRRNGGEDDADVYVSMPYGPYITEINKKEEQGILSRLTCSLVR